MRLLLLLLTLALAPSFLGAQLSNVRQTAEGVRIIVTYDLSGDSEDRYDISVVVTNESGFANTPTAIVGDLNEVAPGRSRSIWWEPQLEGFAASGWKVSLTAKKGLGIKWVRVEGGPRGAFSMSATEVTFDQYDAFCNATGHEEPMANFGRGKQPVINVNVADAVAFCEWMSKETGKTVRLPEEDEWEFAARGGKKSKGYEYSGSNDVGAVAWYDGNSGSKTHEVATKKPNELGLYDMSGNVWEWCGTRGVVRGGSWFDFDGCRVSYRYVFVAGLRGSSFGFRVLQN
jgi:hypothetical protein